jgi:cytokinin riboside 5'-monophosphate phosphoribohydrolase
MRICVFCSSAESAVPGFGDLAVRTGRELVGRGHELVYGGTAVGMMAVLARTVRGGGGRVTGIVPRLLVERGLADDTCDELVVTEDMGDRKTTMVARSDAFLALPGGLGTLDELLEVVTLKQLGYHDEPIAVVNPDGFWDPLVAMLAQLHARDMSLPPDDLALVTPDLAHALDHLEAGGRAPDRPWRA